MVSSESAPARVSSPAAGCTSPAIRRNNEDLPAPLGPVTTSASPAPTAKPRPEKTCRPPRMQARSDAVSRIGSPSSRSRRSLIFGPDGGPSVGPAGCKIGNFLPMLLARVDYLEPRQKRPYKPQQSALIQQATRMSRPATNWGDPVMDYRDRTPSGRMGNDRHDFA